MKGSLPQLVFVLGMHRSGTSAVTRGLEVLGVDLGDRLMDPLPGVNDRGFYEDRDIFELNEKILRTLDQRSWHSLRPIDPKEFQSPAISELRSAVTELLIKKIGSSPRYAIKDSRLSILLPFWQDVSAQVGVAVKYLIVTRNPISVTKSLEKRDALDPFKCYFLWLQHTASAINYTNQMSRLVVDYDLLIADPESQLSRIARFLEVSFDPDSHSFADYRENFLDSSLRHTQFDLSELRQLADLPDGVGQLYSVLLDIARDRIELSSEPLYTILGPITENISALGSMFVYLDRVDNLCRSMHDEIIKLRAENAQQKQAISDLHKINGLLTDQKQALSAQIASQESELSRKVEQLGFFEERSRSLETKLHSITSSRSWRLTRPLRGFRRLVG
jgi:hypothetical protein